MKIYWFPNINGIYGFLDFVGNIYLSEEMCTINLVNSNGEKSEEDVENDQEIQSINLRKKAF